ncbi:MAG: hypothetical protein AAF740_09585 [Bacteroidota bacterium]
MTNSVKILRLSLIVASIFILGLSVFELSVDYSLRKKQEIILSQTEEVVEGRLPMLDRRARSEFRNIQSGVNENLNEPYEVSVMRRAEALNTLFKEKDSLDYELLTTVKSLIQDDSLTQVFEASTNYQLLTPTQLIEIEHLLKSIRYRYAYALALHMLNGQIGNYCGYHPFHPHARPTKNYFEANENISIHVYFWVKSADYVPLPSTKIDFKYSAEPYEPASYAGEYSVTEQDAGKLVITYEIPPNGFKTIRCTTEVEYLVLPPLHKSN